MARELYRHVERVGVEVRDRELLRLLGRGHDTRMYRRARRSLEARQLRAPMIA
jgi:hypothetical protein